MVRMGVGMEAVCTHGVVVGLPRTGHHQRRETVGLAQTKAILIWPPPQPASVGRDAAARQLVPQVRRLRLQVCYFAAVQSSQQLL